MEEKKYKVIESEYLIRRPWLTARRDKLQLPDGAINPEYYVLEYPDWVNTIAITKEGDFIFVRQYRHGIDEMSTEICAGVIEKGEDPLTAAKRELWEETGYGNGTWQPWMRICGNPSTTNNWTHCFLATDVERVCDKQHLDKTERIEVLHLTYEEVKKLLMDDQMKQALMAAPLWKYVSMRENKG